MRTILYPDGNIPKAKYFNNGDNFYTLMIFSLILIFVVLTIVLYFYGRTPLQESLVSTCPAGYCATSLETGYKRCPLSVDQRIYIDPAAEICNPAFYCTAVETPYAVLTDNSTDLNGDCGGQVCACVKTRTCPNYSMVVFGVDGDNDYSQNAIGTIPTGGIIGYELAPNEKCVINYSELENVGCVNKTSTQCVQQNPCIAGVLSFIPPPNISPENFVQLPNYDISNMTCLAGPVCPSGSVSVYNSVLNTAECVSLP